MSEPAGRSASDGPPRQIILCADDYGLSAGVSDGILDLAERRCLSATSAIVTAERWPQDAKRARAARDRLAVGLHIDLTLFPPLGPMPVLAPAGRPATLRRLIAHALLGRIDPHEVASEVARQVDRFETEFGHPPDHIDGHQHVHVLAGVRDGVLSALEARFPTGGPLVRDPSDRPSAILRRRLAICKALAISTLALGFGKTARAKRFAVNTSFSGTSRFDTRKPYTAELRAALAAPGRRHLVMCHPGHADRDLARLDPIVGRREQEYEAIRRNAALTDVLWRPQRAADGPPVTWQQD